MNISERQIGRIEAAIYALRQLTARNDVGAVLVGTISEVVDDITNADYNCADECALLPEPQIPYTVDDVRQYGREVIDQGAGLKEAIKLICDNFNMTHKEFARTVGIPESSLCYYVNYNQRRSSVIAGMTEFFGLPGGAPVTEAERK